MPKKPQRGSISSNFNELNLTALTQQLDIGIVQQVLSTFWNNGFVVDTLIVTPSQFQHIMKWKIDPPDISKPVNFDMARMKIRVFNPFF